MTESYHTIASPAEGIYKEKGSRFLAFAFPVKNEDEIKVHLQTIKKEHHQCNHHCYAFRLNADGSQFRSSDDREPSGTAGRPILNQLIAHDLTFVFIVVARYFGGSLLGVPGLINAYRSAAADAIANATIITREVTVSVQLHFSYEKQHEVMALLKNMGISIVHESYGEVIRLQVEMPVARENHFRERLMESGIAHVE